MNLCAPMHVIIILKDSIDYFFLPYFSTDTFASYSWANGISVSIFSFVFLILVYGYFTLRVQEPNCLHKYNGHMTFEKNFKQHDVVSCRRKMYALRFLCHFNANEIWRRDLVWTFPFRPIILQQNFADFYNDCILLVSTKIKCGFSMHSFIACDVKLKKTPAV